MLRAVSSHFQLGSTHSHSPSLYHARQVLVKNNLILPTLQIEIFVLSNARHLNAKDILCASFRLYASYVKETAVPAIPG